MKKICRDDEVIVLAGRDRTKTGRVQSVLPNGRAVVSGINKVKRHVKPNPNLNRTGGIEEREASIHLSNLAVLNPKTGKGERVGILTEADTKQDGKMVKLRIFKRSDTKLPSHSRPSAKSAASKTAKSKTKAIEKK